MISIEIPGFGKLDLAHVVVDYNGTLALDGLLPPGVGEALAELARQIRIHVVTADTFGLAEQQLMGLPVALTIMPVASQAEAKARFVSQLGADSVVAIGNGRNDWKMLSVAAVGIALVQREGAAAETLVNADVVTVSILDAIDLLRNPRRLVATLRS